MQDRELLEMAAKASGIKVEHDGKFAFPYGLWNPLENDGDALRLATDLRLIIKSGKYKGDGCTVESQDKSIAGCTCFRDDKYEQMRRAIVHVAAEIGKAMK